MNNLPIYRAEKIDSDEYVIFNSFYEYENKYYAINKIINQTVVNFEKYFYVNQIGDIKYDYANNTAIKRYRVFKTEDESEKYAKYIKAEETLRKAIAEANEGWLPNWTSN